MSQCKAREMLFAVLRLRIPEFTASEQIRWRVLRVLVLCVLYTYNLFIFGDNWLAITYWMVETITLFVGAYLCVVGWFAIKGRRLMTHEQWKGLDGPSDEHWYVKAADGFLFGYVVVGGATNHFQTTLQLSDWLWMIVVGMSFSASYILIMSIVRRFSRSP